MFGLSSPWLSLSLTCIGRKKCGTGQHIRQDRFGDLAFELINSVSVGWGKCQGGLRMHKSWQSNKGAEEVIRICQVCLSWNIIPYRAKVTGSLHTEKSVLWREGTGKLPALSSAYYRETGKVLIFQSHRKALVYINVTVTYKCKLSTKH